MNSGFATVASRSVRTSSCNVTRTGSVRTYNSPGNNAILAVAEGDAPERGGVVDVQL